MQDILSDTHCGIFHVPFPRIDEKYSVQGTAGKPLLVVSCVQRIATWAAGAAVYLDRLYFDEGARGTKLDFVALSSLVAEEGELVPVGDVVQCPPCIDSGNILVQNKDMDAVSQSCAEHDEEWRAFLSVQQSPMFTHDAVKIELAKACRVGRKRQHSSAQHEDLADASVTLIDKFVANTEVGGATLNECHRCHEQIVEFVRSAYYDPNKFAYSEKKSPTPFESTALQSLKHRLILVSHTNSKISSVSSTRSKLQQSQRNDGELQAI